MKQIKIGLTLFTCIVLLFQCDLVKAIHVLPQEAVAFYGTKVYKDIYYQDKILEIPIVMGMYKEVQFPVYALSKEKHALDESTAFYTHANMIIQNDEIRKILLYGYPNCNYTRLNCTNEEEAYLVTQIAIWNQYYHYDLSEFSFTKENKYSNIIRNVQAFLEDLDCMSVNKKNPYLSIEERIFEWQDENENELSKTYQVLSDMAFEKYQIEVESSEAQYIKIVNEENKPQKSFSSGEKFKILVPNSLDINFKITATANFETLPVKAGNGYEDYWESYLFLEETETIEAILTQSSIHKPVEPSNPDKEPTVPGESNNPDKEPTVPGESNNPDKEPTEPEETSNIDKESTVPGEPSNTDKEQINPEENNKNEEDSKENNNNTENKENSKNETNHSNKNPNNQLVDKNKENNQETNNEQKTQESTKQEKTNIENNQKDKGKNTQNKEDVNSMKNGQNKKLPRTGC